MDIVCKNNEATIQKTLVSVGLGSPTNSNGAWNEIEQNSPNQTQCNHPLNTPIRHSAANLMALRLHKLSSHHGNIR